jgi:hypothetical protein
LGHRNFAALRGYDTMLGRMPGLWNGSKSARSRKQRSALGMCLLSALAISACSAVVDTDKAKLGPVPVPCEPGQSVTCPCRDGSTSMQRCNAMARFDRCACGGVAGQGSGGTVGSMTAGRGTSTSAASR